MAATATHLQQHPTIAILGREIASDSDIDTAIRAGLSTSALKQLQAVWNLTIAELSSALAIPRSTLLQMMRSPRKMSSADSDRLYRVTQILSLAEQYIGNRQHALGWFRTPNSTLGSVTPFHAIETEIGRQRVIQVLGAIAYGGVA